jgi:hypothetical protein
MKREDFSVSADKGGYMLYYKGKPIGGAGTLSNGANIRGKAVQIQIRDYREQGKMEIACILAGVAGRYEDIIKKIDNETNDNGKT